MVRARTTVPSWALSVMPVQAWALEPQTIAAATAAAITLVARETLAVFIIANSNKHPGSGKNVTQVPEPNRWGNRRHASNDGD